MKIEQRILRRTPEDIIEIGYVLDRFYNGQAGAVVRAIINGRISSERKDHQIHVSVPADRVLGRLEGYQNIIDDIELAIQQMKELTEEIKDEGRDNNGQEI